MPETIREATAADVPSLEVIRRQALEAGLTGEYARGAFVDLVATPDDRLRNRIAAAETLVLVAETDVTPIGYGVYDTTEARIRGLYTAPEYQGEGCASALLDRFETRAREDGRDRLRATVPRNAVGFFRNRGFERRGTTERDGLSMVVVVKPISPSR